MNNSGEQKKNRRRGLWSPHEDEKLLNFISSFGVSSWSSLPNQAGLERCPKSCRLRWMNHLRPELKKEPISREEKDMIIAFHKKIGNRWALIAERMPGRTDNEIKNYYNGHIKKKMLKKSDQNTPNPTSLSLAVVQESDLTGTIVFEFQSNEKMESNSDPVKSKITKNELSLICDCEENYKQNLDVKRLEEYVNDLFELIC